MDGHHSNQDEGDGGFANAWDVDNCSDDNATHEDNAPAMWEFLGICALFASGPIVLTVGVVLFSLGYDPDTVGLVIAGAGFLSLPWFVGCCYVISRVMNSDKVTKGVNLITLQPDKSGKISVIEYGRYGGDEGAVLEGVTVGLDDGAGIGNGNGAASALTNTATEAAFEVGAGTPVANEQAIESDDGVGVGMPLPPQRLQSARVRVAGQGINRRTRSEGLKEARNSVLSQQETNLDEMTRDQREISIDSASESVAIVPINRMAGASSNSNYTNPSAGRRLHTGNNAGPGPDPGPGPVPGRGPKHAPASVSLVSDAPSGNGHEESDLQDPDDGRGTHRLPSDEPGPPGAIQDTEE